jgi:hypothetical protein
MDLFLHLSNLHFGVSADTESHTEYAAVPLLSLLDKCPTHVARLAVVSAVVDLLVQKSNFDTVGRQEDLKTASMLASRDAPNQYGLITCSCDII